MELNPIIHQPLRLQIMATLVALDTGDRLNFVELRSLVDATDGNLGTHLQKLENEGYIEVEKTFVARKPCTYLKATIQGRSAFEAHLKALKTFIQSVEVTQ